jgi:hypothetical protein
MSFSVKYKAKIYQDFGQCLAELGMKAALEPVRDVKNSRKKGGESNEKERIPSM